MKIDIHTHTKKCKSGDAPTREVTPVGFCEAVLSSEVRIIAITNHNAFDLAQYTEIDATLSGEVQVWPGIELDVRDGGSTGHVLVIVSPKHATSFSEAVHGLTRGSSLDSFTATVDLVLATFDCFKPLYVAHYKQKKPSLADDALAKLVAGTHNRSCVIKEVTNSISAGIYIAHGHASIFGSDVQNWAEYSEVSRGLPDLRLPVDSFEHFCLLLEKDPTTINTVLDRKTSEDLILLPFEDGSILKIRAFDDITVVFGPKGTGKSCILRAIAKHYAENGVDARVYVPASDRLDQILDTKGRDLTINLNDYGVNYCTNEIEAVRAATELGVTNLSKYVAFFAAKSTNRNAKRILIKDIEPEEESGVQRNFVDVKEAADTTSAFIEFLAQNRTVKENLSEDEHRQLTLILSALLKRLSTKKWATFCGWKAICFLNSAIRAFRTEIERKTGTPAKPTTTGFREYALNRITIAVNAAAIVESADTKIPMISEPVGSLGADKGALEFRTELAFQTGAVTDGSLSSLSGTKKGTQKKFSSCVRDILRHAYADDLFQYIAELNAIEDVEGVKTVYELLLFKRFFALDGAAYSPSSGEASMVMLQKELGADKDVYILDEPERSLGNEYISDVIVPLIKERARANRKVFIATHDANIAVRPLPYSSIYRCHGRGGYRTYVGNPFSNDLVNVDDAADRLDWKKISMRTLEGGEEAFGERGNIYGND
jgi:predicted ATPase